MTYRFIRRVLAATFGASVLAIVGVSPASAHPLGNFSINHLDSLSFTASRVVDQAIVDTAEIPTAQAASTIDSDGDGTASLEEMSRYADSQCADYLDSLRLTVDGAPATFSTTATSLEYRPGQAGLQTTRLECRFEAAVKLSAERTVNFENSFAPNRVGWHEIVASSDGVTLVDSPVAISSVTSGLTKYPVDLLSSPLDVRSASFTVEPGAGATGQPTFTKTPSKSFFARLVAPFSSAVERVNGTFNDLVGRRQLTVGIGLLAIGLALLLGASHALLPGHGKTVMAAYIAGRQGSVRDAVLVGATVTATHTGGVLLLGLALTVSTSLAGESVLRYLGVISGLMIAVLGAGLLRSALRRRRSLAPGDTHGHHGGHHHGEHHHGYHHGHTHSAGHGHTQRHASGHRHGPAGYTDTGADVDLPGAPLVGAGRLALVSRAQVGSHQGAGSSLIEDRASVLDGGSASDKALEILRAGNNDLSKPAAVPMIHGHRDRPVSRLGLVGMGIAGGLVPSPSALVVLLSAIALGRTIFGVVLVIGYGAGMAGTLTLAGVLLVRLRDRYQDRTQEPAGRARRLVSRWTRTAPYLTACLVLVVGLGLAVRSLRPL